MSASESKACIPTVLSIVHSPLPPSMPASGFTAPQDGHLVYHAFIHIAHSLSSNCFLHKMAHLLKKIKCLCDSYQMFVIGLKNKSLKKKTTLNKK